MKYGAALAILAALTAACAVRNGGMEYLLLWPALSLSLVSTAYFSGRADIFGKRSDGTLLPLRSLLLAAFLVSLTLVWYLARYCSGESPYNQLTDKVFIGRRLLSNERPTHFDHIVDQTCEFNEPFHLRSSGYLSFPTLDGHFTAPDLLLQRVAQIAELDGTIYIHCAQGHGRTATFAFAY